MLLLFGTAFAFFSFFIFIWVKMFQQYTFLMFLTFFQSCTDYIKLFFSSPVNAIGIITLLWGVYALLKIFSTVIKNMKLRRFLKTKSLKQMPLSILEILNKHKINSGLLFVVDSDQHYAFCQGFINPKIVLSTGLFSDLDSRELEAVVLHEYSHVSRKHLPFMLFMRLAASITVPAPILNEIFILLKGLWEREADAYVIQRLKSSEALNSALLKVRPANLKHFGSLMVSFKDSSTNNGAKPDTRKKVNSRDFRTGKKKSNRALEIRWGEFLYTTVVSVLFLLMGYLFITFPSKKVFAKHFDSVRAECSSYDFPQSYNF